jgi:hypothetical protein
VAVNVLFSLLVPLVLLTLFLLALFFVVRSAVEGGLRRALRHDLLRPSVRDLLAGPDPRRLPPDDDPDT